MFHVPLKEIQVYILADFLFVLGLPGGYTSWCYCFSSCCHDYNIQTFRDLLRANILPPHIQCKSLPTTWNPSLFLLRIIVIICTMLKTLPDNVKYFLLNCHMYLKNLRGESGEGGGGGMNWEIGIDIYTPVCIK